MGEDYELMVSDVAREAGLRSTDVLFLINRGILRGRRSNVLRGPLLLPTSSVIEAARWYSTRPDLLADDSCALARELAIAA